MGELLKAESCGNNSRRALHILPPYFHYHGSQDLGAFGQHTACDSFYIYMYIFFFFFFCGKDTIKMGVLEEFKERKGHRRIRSHVACSH